jgi:hypothetical protein
MMNEIKERPMLFSSPMVQAVVSGNKTQTRRVVKLPKKARWGTDYDGQVVFDDGSTFGCEMAVDEMSCHYGRIGDRIWVRETFSAVVNIGTDKNGDTAKDLFSYNYKADLTAPIGGYWKSPIHMPRAASRILLEIIDVRVERLHDISKQDAIAEGIKTQTGMYCGVSLAYYSPIDAYKDIWESINGAGSWSKNPWVYVIDFKVVEIKT